MWEKFHTIMAYNVSKWSIFQSLKQCESSVTLTISKQKEIHCVKGLYNNDTAICLFFVKVAYGTYSRYILKSLEHDNEF